VSKREIETVAEILHAYRTGSARPVEIVERSYARIRAHNDPATFISLLDEKDAAAEVHRLEAESPSDLPLYGIPVAVKDNIDVRTFVPHRVNTAVARPLTSSVDNSKRRQRAWSSPSLNLHAPRAAASLPHRITISDTLPAAEDEAVAEPSQSTIRIPPKYRYCHLAE
jgi:hypothetical protein